jgi:hypothetical protein
MPGSVAWIAAASDKQFWRALCLAGTPAAALKGSLSEDVVALSAMVVDQSCR